MIFFHPYLGKWSNLTNFSNGLKPPSREMFIQFCICENKIQMIPIVVWKDEHTSGLWSNLQSELKVVFLDLADLDWNAVWNSMCFGWSKLSNSCFLDIIRVGPWVCVRLIFKSSTVFFVGSNTPHKLFNEGFALLYWRSERYENIILQMGWV